MSDSRHRDQTKQRWGDGCQRRRAPQILDLDVTSGDEGAGWLSFFRGLTGTMPVTSDAHAGLVAAIGATLPGASLQRCSNHPAGNLMGVTPKSSWPWVRTLLHSVDDQPDANAVHEQHDRVLDALSDKLSAGAEHRDAPSGRGLASGRPPDERS